MTKQVQRRRGTATQHTSFTGAEGELSVNTTNKSVHVHDNVTAGGFEAARADMDNVTSSSILTAAGITATTAELNYVDGVTSNIQTQLDGKAGTASPTFTGTLTTANLTATGTTNLAGASTSADITFGDNVKATFGNSDLQIYHDGFTSVIEEAGSGDLRLKGTNIDFKSATNETYAYFQADGASILYHNGSDKLATTSTGVDITGVLTSDGFEALHTSGDVGYRLGYNTGSSAFIHRDSATGHYLLQSDETGSSWKIQTDNGAGPVTRAEFDRYGDISFFEDTGTTAKFFWDASAESLGIGTSSPDAALHINTGTTNTVAIFQSTDSSTELKFIDSVGSTQLRSIDGELAFRVGGDGGATTNTTEAMRIDSSGNVGIGGITSLSDRLHLRTSTGSVGMRFNVDDAGDFRIVNDGSSNLTFIAGASTERMRIDSSGNVGIGVVPEAWASNFSATQNGTAFANGGTDDASFGFMSANAYRSSTGWKYINTNVASLYAQSASSHQWSTAASGTADTAISWSEAMRIDSSGNLLVGTTSTSASVVGGRIFSGGRIVTSTTSEGHYFRRNSTDGTIVEFAKDGTTVGSIGSVFGVTSYIDGGATHTGLRFDSSAIIPRDAGAITDGTVELGASTNRFKDLYLSGTIEIENGTGNVGVGKQALNSNTGSNNTAIGYQAGYTGTSTSANTFVGRRAGYSVTTANGNTFIGNNSGVDVTTGQNNTIIGRYGGNSGGLDIRTSSNNIVLSDGDGNPRGVFDSSGNFMVGAVAQETQGVTLYGTGANGFYIKTTATCGYLITRAGQGAGSGTITTIYSDTTAVGSITVTASSTAYNTSSDHRLKENVVELTGATDRLKQLEPKRFNFIADADTTVDGFIAHEVQSVVPEAITGTHNEVDDEGNPVYQGIDQSKLVPLLVATIKELEARITALENA